jgi:NAD(P)-dependent dehydrogenase (short-subunit alcohol dehydrogenase family)
LKVNLEIKEELHKAFISVNESGFFVSFHLDIQLSISFHKTEFGPITILINNAAVLSAKNVEDLSYRQLERL